MVESVATETLVLPDPETAGRALAAAVAESACTTLSRQARFSLVVSGGRTPEPFLRSLAVDYVASVAWDRVDLFWADERAVPATDPESNVGFVTALLGPQLTEAGLRLHPMLGARVPSSAAASLYETELRAYFGVGPQAEVPTETFDFVALGLGPDGHTASLFPPPFLAPPETAWVTGTPPAPVAPHVPRISLGFGVINRSRDVAFLVTGADKQRILRAVRHPSDDRERSLPAARIRAVRRLRWFVDAAAAGTGEDRA
jgi:6-phosphogluconolactonase